VRGDLIRVPVPLSTKVFYGSGSIAEGTKNTAFNVFLLFYYNQVLGLSGTLAGAAIFLALCVDAITDPLTGSLSDSFHSRWGRRHPFMYAAAAPMALCFFLLFNPPAGLAETGLFLWLTAFAVGVRVSMTLYSIPSSAMIPELTENYDERTTLVSWRFLFGWMGGLAMSLVGYLYFFAKAADGSDGRLDPSAYGWFALACAIVIVAAIFSCALGTHHLIPTLRTPAAGPRFSPGRFGRELRDVFSNRSYRMLVVAAVFAAVAGGFNDVVGLYVNTYFWEFSTNQIAVLIWGLVFATLLAFDVTPRLAARFDKKRATVGILTFAIVVGPMPILLRLAGWFPPNGHPSLLPIILVHLTIIVAAVISVSITVASMIADVVDEGELATGKRQEGMFTAAIAFSAKATSGLGGLFAGIALDLIAFPKGADPGTVPPGKVFNLGLAVGPGLMFFYFVTLAFIARYRITRERHGEILAELEHRRAEAPSPPSPPPPSVSHITD
jgi:GPH family glycoside/pentoside/hexuronide:cation symporter